MNKGKDSGTPIGTILSELPRLTSNILPGAECTFLLAN